MNMLWIVLFLFDQLKKLATEYHGNDTKITLASLKEHRARMNFFDQWVFNEIELMQSAMLKQLPAERVSGVLNVFYALNGRATDETLEHAMVRWSRRRFCVKYKHCVDLNW